MSACHRIKQRSVTDIDADFYLPSCNLFFYPCIKKPNDLNRVIWRPKGIMAKSPGNVRKEDANLLLLPAIISFGVPLVKKSGGQLAVINIKVPCKLLH